jgi:large subunit ribosomal protein L21
MPDNTGYAVIRTGGKQYRVAEGQTLLIERLTADEGATVELEPLLVAGDGDPVFDADGLGSAKVTATVIGHERGPKVRIFKFKPKRGYKRRKGHRQELTRIRVDSIGSSSGRSRSGSSKQAAAATEEA